MFGFLRPFLIVFVLTGVFVAVVGNTHLKNQTYIMDAADAADIEADPGDAQRLMDKLFWPVSFLPEDVQARMNWIDFSAYCLGVGFAGWMLLESLWAFIKPRDRDQRRSIFPSFSFGRLICFGLFAVLVFYWVTQRMMVEVPLAV